MMLEGKYGTSESVDKVKECMNNYVDLILKNKKQCWTVNNNNINIVRINYYNIIPSINILYL